MHGNSLEIQADLNVCILIGDKRVRDNFNSSRREKTIPILIFLAPDFLILIIDYRFDLRRDIFSTYYNKDYIFRIVELFFETDKVVHRDGAHTLSSADRTPAEQALCP